MAKRILMVDDEPDLVTATRLYFEAQGYEVIAAYDGTQALEALKRPEARPDLIVLDVRMPGLSGWDVLRMIRASDEWRALPVVMLTAADRDADKARGWELGVDWYQTKPFDPNTLLVIVERVLQAGAAETPEDG